MFTANNNKNFRSPAMYVVISALMSLAFLSFQPAVADEAKVVVPANVLEASAMTSKAWLDLIDKGQYGASWDESSFLMKRTIKRGEWEQAMTMTRKPLGNVTSRQVADQRTAKNPHGLLPGDYMVMFYNTSFSHKSNGHELVTLFFENGQWRVLTYQFD